MVMANLARFHREHEKFYSQAPLRQADDVQAASRALKALAAQWGEATAVSTLSPIPTPARRTSMLQAWSPRAASSLWRGRASRSRSQG
jgi:hypothetical protein